MAKVEATPHYGARGGLVGAAFEEALAARAAPTPRRRARRSSTPFEDRGDRRARGRSGSSSPSRCRTLETVVVPVGGGGLASGHRDRAAGAAARGAARRRQAEAAPLAGDVGYTIADGIAVKQAGRADELDPRRVLDDLVDGQRRGDQRGDRAPARAREAGRRGRRARRRVAALLAGGSAATGRSRRAPLRRQHRPDAADLGHASRPDARGALPRRCARRLLDRPGELIKLLALVAAERGEHRLRRAPPRGHGHPGRRDRGRADARDARRGALPAPCSARWPSSGYAAERLS